MVRHQLTVGICDASYRLRGERIHKYLGPDISTLEGIRKILSQKLKHMHAQVGGSLSFWEIYFCNIFLLSGHTYAKLSN